MEQITITIHTYSGPPGKIFKGPRSITEAAFLEFMSDNPDVIDDGYIKVTYKHLTAVSHNKVPVLALNDCYKVLFFEDDLKNQEEGNIDDLEVETEDKDLEETSTDLEEPIDDSIEEPIVDDDNHEIEE